MKFVNISFLSLSLSLSIYLSLYISLYLSMCPSISTYLSLYFSLFIMTFEKIIFVPETCWSGTVAWSWSWCPPQSTANSSSTTSLDAFRLWFVGRQDGLITQYASLLLRYTEHLFLSHTYTACLLSHSPLFFSLLSLSLLYLFLSLDLSILYLCVFSLFLARFLWLDLSSICPLSLSLSPFISQILLFRDLSFLFILKGQTVEKLNFDWWIYNLRGYSLRL